MGSLNDPRAMRNKVYYTLAVPDRTQTMATLRTQLRDVGYKPAASLSRKGLVQLLHHHQLERPCYDKCSDSELRKFAIDRGIIAKSSKAGRARLVSLLLKADADPTFTVFSKLPAELRVRIYNFYVDNLVQVPLMNPADPPLALASRLTRNEVLPIFYQRCTFAFTFRASLNWAYQPTYPSKRFVPSLSPVKLSNIRKLKFEYFRTVPEHGDPQIPCGYLELEFSKDTKSYGIQPSEFSGTQFHSILQRVTNSGSENRLQGLEMMELLEAAREWDLG